MNKSDIEQIRIDIECGGESTLSMMLRRDGTLGRSGNGSLPRDGIACFGMSDGSAFHALIDTLNEAVFPQAGAYEIKEKRGSAVRYTIGFFGEGDRLLAGFDFQMGLENRNVGPLVAYFDGFAKRAVALTDDWHKETLRKRQDNSMHISPLLSEGCSEKPVSKDPVAADAPIIKVAVFADGRITADGQPATIDSLLESFKCLAKEKGAVWYYRETGQGKPPPQAMEVIQAVVAARLPIRLSSRPDYSDAIGTDGKPIKD